MALGTDLGLGPVHIVLDADTPPLPKKRQSPPNFLPIYIMAKRLDASIKMPLGMEVGQG